MFNATMSIDSIILISDPRILAIPIFDNQEPMIDLKHHNDIAYGPSPEIPNNTDYTQIRKTIYEKLQVAQKSLPKELRFCLYEGYRSLQLQKMLFEKRIEKLKKEHPEWPQEKVFLETTQLVSPVINLDGSDNILPHATGGAIDIYLINDQSIAIDMGMHPKDWMQDDGSLSLTLSKDISSDAQRNRKIMYEVLSSIGFVNYPTEYWHWSYGDRYWAYHSHQSHAIYGALI